MASGFSTLIRSVSWRPAEVFLTLQSYESNMPKMCAAGKTPRFPARWKTGGSSETSAAFSLSVC